MLHSGHRVGGKQLADNIKIIPRVTFADPHRGFAHTRNLQRQIVRNKYVSTYYKVRYKVLLKTSVIRDAYCRSQQSNKLMAKRIRSSKVLELVCRNMARFKLPPTVQGHPVLMCHIRLPIVSIQKSSGLEANRRRSRY